MWETNKEFMLKMQDKNIGIEILTILKMLLNIPTYNNDLTFTMKDDFSWYFEYKNNIIMVSNALDNEGFDVINGEDFIYMIKANEDIIIDYIYRSIRKEG